MKKQNMKMRFLLLAVTLCFSALAATAQTSNFTYQGRFTDATVAQPTNGTYNMQFTLFDAASGGSQVGATVTIPTVQVVGGVFSVTLDYGTRAFNASDRFIQISVQPAGGSGYTTLSPRQQITSAPFAINSASADFAATASNAVKLGGAAASSYTLNTDARLSDDRNPAAGSENYIQNQNSVLQSGDFKIGGSGTVNGFFTAGSVNTGTNYKIGTAIVFSTPNQTSVTAGQSANYNVTGAYNTFFGYATGAGTSLSAANNTFIGSQAGQVNTTGESNTFVGEGAGYTNTTGSFNAAFGYGASGSGDRNVAVGYSTTAEGNMNSTLGVQSYTSGNKNVAVGANNFVNGNSNTIIGDGAVTGGANPVSNSTAIGAGATVSTSNTIVLGTNAELTSIPGTLSVTKKISVISLGAAGSTSLCRNSFNEISTCTAGNSPEKDASRIAAFDTLNQQNLQMKTQIEQQQKQITEQEESTKQLKLQIDALRKLVCASNSTAQVCRQ